jgi:hypothetical protein
LFGHYTNLIKIYLHNLGISLTNFSWYVMFWHIRLGWWLKGMCAKFVSEMSWCGSLEEQKKK